MPANGTSCANMVFIVGYQPPRDLFLNRTFRIEFLPNAVLIVFSGWLRSDEYDPK